MADEPGSEAQSTTGQAKQKVQEKAGEATQQMKEKAGETTQQVKEKAHEVRGPAGGRVRQEVDTRSTEAGTQLESTAQAMRQTSEQLRSQGKETPAKVTEAVAQRAERLGGYLTNSDADRILRDVEDYARRNPWAVAVGGLLAGFAASRFLKASSSQRYRSSADRPLGASQRDEAWQPTATVEAPVIPAAEPPIVEPVEPEVAEPIGRPDDPTYGYDWRAGDRPATDPER